MMTPLPTPFRRCTGSTGPRISLFFREKAIGFPVLKDPPLFQGHSGRRGASDCGTGCRRARFLRIFSRF